MQQHGNRGDGDQNDETRRRYADLAQLEPQRCDLGRYVVAFSPGYHQDDVLEDGEQGKGREHLHHRFRLKRLDDQALDDESEEEQRRHDEHYGQVRIDSEQRVSQEGAIHAEHHQLARGEVDHPDDAEDEVEPDAHQPVDAAKQNADDKHVQYGAHFP